jgi:hypothetical protein
MPGTLPGFFQALFGSHRYIESHVARPDNSTQRLSNGLSGLRVSVNTKNLFLQRGFVQLFVPLLINTSGSNPVQGKIVVQAFGNPNYYQ